MSKEEDTEQNFRISQNSLRNYNDKITVRTVLKPVQTTQNFSLDSKIDKVERIERVSKIFHKPSLEEEKRTTRRKSQNFILKNIKNAAKTKKIEYDTDEDITDLSSISNRRRSSSSSKELWKNWSIRPKVPIINYNVNPKEIVEEDEKEKEQRDIEKTISERLSVLSKDKADVNAQKPNDESETKKHYIKLTTCPACMEKWKTPLPSPKTPRIKRNSTAITKDEFRSLKTNVIVNLNINH